jgi:acyl-CoA reductase-like NAD-dependent aldehyde dehydrogenase
VVRRGTRSYLWAYHGKIFGKVDKCYLGPLKARSRAEVDLVALALDSLAQYAREAEKRAEGLEPPERAAHLAFAAEKLAAAAEEALQLAERLSALAMREAARARGRGFRLKGGLAHALLSPQ